MEENNIKNLINLSEAEINNLLQSNDKLNLIKSEDKYLFAIYLIGIGKYDNGILLLKNLTKINKNSTESIEVQKCYDIKAKYKLGTMYLTGIDNIECDKEKAYFYLRQIRDDYFIQEKLKNRDNIDEMAKDVIINEYCDTLKHFGDFYKDGTMVLQDLCIAKKYYGNFVRIKLSNLKKLPKDMQDIEKNSIKDEYIVSMLELEKVRLKQAIALNCSFDRVFQQMTESEKERVILEKYNKKLRELESVNMSAIDDFGGLDGVTKVI